MLLENYQGDSKVLKAIAHILNRKAPLPLDGDGNAEWGTNGQVLKTDGTGSTYWDDESGGGDSVSWTQLQSTGTKIAEIDINGTPTDVYVPNNGGGGDSVSWNQIEQRGTKIAEIDINGTTTDVYAPDGRNSYTVIDETSEPVMTFDADYVEVSNHNFVLVTEWTATSTSVTIDSGYCTKVTPFVTGVIVSDVEIV